MRRRGIKGNLPKLGVLCLALLLGMGSLAVGYAAWTDPLTIGGTVNTGSWSSSGTPGFWKSWDSHNTYTQEEIEEWLENIDGDSGWLGGHIEDISDMVAVFDAGEGDGPTMPERFLRHYLATRLNVEAGRLSPGTFHLFGSYDSGDYLNMGGQGTLEFIIIAIEGKEGTSPTEAQFEIMKNICDALNNILI